MCTKQEQIKNTSHNRCCCRERDIQDNLNWYKKIQLLGEDLEVGAGKNENNFFLAHLWKDIYFISNFIASRYLLLIYNFSYVTFYQKVY